ncbi:CocE/NonD family hydrolase [Pseudonocardia sp. KRD-184]|uniref:CocE/NonD family hydrolase n=1 Tax=Pseudonocardia oceani TaxID=2792013 RepID=A0ABS6U4L5_9PSEU|nr:CocE/NonD family hydrolase [Pseudonocardia oceani]MBW0088433.1 CocE/NonD family hydrolase [Pseudonocardia oceani]MBW0096984.1 CocE/NonD family hydrolase [Pseudonocardia oceani]MBW0121611.1 CocE/NonD family hydrolase [Pseudonocardia oceani]MBW0127099.1 CocE/NonD family hydrolase [Pseudonocardia oceani]
MRVRETFPYETGEAEHVWVPMPDGSRLSGRLWRPRSAVAEPVPAVLEAIPYRHRDLTAVRDSIHHPYLAGHGYACLRVDLRGSGDSDGVLLDEYTEQEHRDVEATLGWLAEQPWCTGRTGMMGISWGAFAGLQVAARRPPSLGAVVIASFTDDRYADDMHYMGGCLLSDNLAESGTMFAYSTLPPDPAVVGERWREMWHERLDAAEPWILKWLAHQRRDDYWRRASVCEDYSAVQVPVFASSGWADGYSNAVFRALEHLDVPRKGLIGPWSHKYPHLGQPGPAIGYLQEVVRWFDRWLRDDDNGADDGPMLTTWMQDSVPPSTAYEERPGRWVGEPGWPSPHVTPVARPLAPHRIGEPGDDVAEHELGLQSPLSVGQFAGKWASYNAPPDLPYDQREEDGGSLVFDTGPLRERCEILGAPVVELDIAADRPVAMVAARLSDVAPDGRATRVSYGLLNLTRRDGDDPRPVEPGRRYRVRLQLNGVAQTFPPGHRIRLSLSSSYWPLAWPAPEPAELSVQTGASRLVLPVRRGAEPDDGPVRPFEDPEGAAPISTTQLEPGESAWNVTRDLIGYRSALEIVKDGGVLRHDDIDLTVAQRVVERYESIAEDFTSPRGDVVWSVSFCRGEWETRTVSRTVLSCTPSTFEVYAELDAFEGDHRVFSRTWERSLPRDCL